MSPSALLLIAFVEACSALFWQLLCTLQLIYVLAPCFLFKSEITITLHEIGDYPASTERHGSKFLKFFVGTSSVIPDCVLLNYYTYLSSKSTNL